MEPNELNDKSKFNWKRLSITIGILIVTTGAIGGSVYYVMNQQAQKDQESAEKTAQDLQKQVSILETQVADLKKTPASASTTTTATTTTTTPVVAWKAGVDISAQEKSTITKKIIEPYLDFEKEQKRTIVSVMVEEIPDGNKKVGEYYYFIDVVKSDGYGEGWAFGESGNIDYWKAVCGLGQCASDAFKTKYPNNWQ